MVLLFQKLKESQINCIGVLISELFNHKNFHLKGHNSIFYDNLKGTVLNFLSYNLFSYDLSVDVIGEHGTGAQNRAIH